MSVYLEYVVKHVVFSQSYPTSVTSPETPSLALQQRHRAHNNDVDNDNDNNDNINDNNINTT